MIERLPLMLSLSEFLLRLISFCPLPLVPKQVEQLDPILFNLIFSSDSL